MKNKLPSGPFIAWLDKRIERYSRDEVAASLGVTNRTMDRWRASKEINYWDLSRLLTRTSFNIHDIYPDFEEAA